MDCGVEVAWQVQCHAGVYIGCMIGYSLSLYFVMFNYIIGKLYLSVNCHVMLELNLQENGSWFDASCLFSVECNFSLRGYYLSFISQVVVVRVVWVYAPQSGKLIEGKEFFM